MIRSNLPLTRPKRHELRLSTGIAIWSRNSFRLVATHYRVAGCLDVNEIKCNAVTREFYFKHGKDFLDIVCARVVNSRLSHIKPWHGEPSCATAPTGLPRPPPLHGGWPAKGPTSGKCGGQSLSLLVQTRLRWSRPEYRPPYQM